MAVYMIDYENVKTGGLNGISRLTAEDSVIIFYSENANRLTFDLHQRLMASPAHIEYREVTVGGHNALDFQLVTYLGFLIAKKPKGQYLIISNDRGFEHVVNFWRKDGLLIGLLPYLKDPAYALQKAVSCEQPRATELPAAKEQEAEPTAETIVAAEDMHQDAHIDVPVSESEPIAEAASEAAVLPDEEPIAETVEDPTTQEQPAINDEPIVEQSVEQPVLLTEEATETAATESEPTFRDGESREELPVEIVAPAPTEVTEEIAAKPAPQKKRSRRQTAAKKQQTERPAAEKQPTKRSAEKPDAKAASAKPKPVAKAVSALPNAKELRTLLDGIVADDPEARLVESVLEKYKTKLGLNNALVKTFGNQKAGEIYQKLKPFLSGKKGC